MHKHVMLVVAWMMVALPAGAAPPSLAKGYWSLGFETDRNLNVTVGYGVADMTRMIVSGSILSTGDLVTGSRETTYDATYSLGLAVQRYFDWASSERFAPFFGGGVEYTFTGQVTEELELQQVGTVELVFDTGDVLSINGRFGVECFPWEPISVSGHVGVLAQMHYEGESGTVTGEQRVLDSGNDVLTFSELFVTFYWGGD